MKMRWLLLIVPMVAAGCRTGGTAATAASLLAYDNIIAANTEAMKGVVAYDNAEKTSIRKTRTEMLHRLHGTIMMAYLEKNAERVPAKEFQADARKFADEIVFQGAENLTALSKHLDNLEEWERRRAGWYSVTVDNLTYAIDVAHDAKQFEMYRANIEEQWRAYLMAQARSRLQKMPAVPARKVE